MKKVAISLFKAAVEKMEANLQSKITEKMSIRDTNSEGFGYLVDGIKHVHALLDEMESWDANEQGVPETVYDLGYTNVKWVAEELFGETKGRVEDGLTFLTEIAEGDKELAKELADDMLAGF